MAKFFKTAVTKGTITFIVLGLALAVSPVRAAVERLPVGVKGPRPPWPLYELVTQCPLIVVGKVNNLLESEDDQELYTFEASEILKGTHGATNIFFVGDSMRNTVPEEMPPSLFSEYYILFLEPVPKEKSGLFRNIIQKIDPSSKILYQVSRKWNGAICLGSKYRDWANKFLEKDYGLRDPEEIKKIIKKACQYLSLTDNGQKAIMLRDFIQSGGLLKEFAAEHTELRFKP